MIDLSGIKRLRPAVFKKHSIVVKKHTIPQISDDPDFINIMKSYMILYGDDVLKALADISPQPFSSAMRIMSKGFKQLQKYYKVE
jgi:hypothetical protein